MLTVADDRRIIRLPQNAGRWEREMSDGDYRQQQEHEQEEWESDNEQV